MPPKTPRQSGASLPATPNLPTYSFGNIVLAKVKGHPAWPARIVDPLASPLNLRDERKIASKNSYLVKFFKTADYAWMNCKEMSILEPPEIQAFINNPNKKGADLKAAYQIALAPDAWEAELEEFQMAIHEEEKALEIDELETVETESADKAVPPKSKQKRKRPSEAKTPAVSTKKRKSVDARPTNVPAKTSATPESPTAAPEAAKKRGKKKVELVVPVDGESVVRDWRHRLQRLFLGKAPLTEKMMPEIDEVFTHIEEFEMKTEWLTASKLAKVLKRVGVLEDSKVPLDAQYSVRERARALQEKWRQQLGLGDESHRSRTGDGIDEARANASADDDNGKENTDPTATIKDEEMMITNGKEPTKPSDSDDVKMDEEDSLPVQVAEDSDEAVKVEASLTDEALITEPQTIPAPEVTPAQANGGHEATNGEPEAPNAEPEAVNGEPEAVNGEPEETNADSGAHYGTPQETDTGSAAAGGAGTETANGEPEAVSGDDIAVNGNDITGNGDDMAVNGGNKAANGDHEDVKENDVTMAEEKSHQDVEMAPVDAEPKTDAKLPAPELDDAEQMELTDAPEPTTVENTEMEREEAV